MKYMAAMKISQTTKKYCDSAVSKMLMTGQLKSITPSVKRKMKISLAIYIFNNLLAAFPGIVSSALSAP